jgi:hypothetical protein
MKKRVILSVLFSGLLLCTTILIITILFITGNSVKNEPLDQSIWDSENRFAEIIIDGKFNEKITGFDLVFIFSEGQSVHHLEKVEGKIELKCLDFKNTSGELEYIKLVPVFSNGARGKPISEIEAGKINKADLVSDGHCEKRTSSSSTGDADGRGASAGGGLSLGGGSSTGGGGSGDSDGSGGSEGCKECPAGYVCNRNICKKDSLVNIASHSEISTNLYSPFNERMVDEVMGTGLIQSYYRYPFEGFSFNQTAEFIFDRSVKISRIRLSLPPKDYNIFADTNGDGNYNAEIAKVINGSGGGFWWKEEWPFEVWNISIDAYAIKILGREKLHLMEFEIYAYEEDVPFDWLEKNVLEKNVPMVTIGEIVLDKEHNNNDYIKGMYVEDWMIGFTQFINYRNKNPGFDFKNWNITLAGGSTQSFEGAMNKLRNMSSNAIWIMPCRVKDTYSGPVMWTSNYINNSPDENYLKMITEAFREENVTVFVGDRPYPEVSGNRWPPKEGYTARETFVRGMAEIAESGADGVSVCFDELCHFPHYIGGENGDIGKAISAAEAIKNFSKDVKTITNVQIYKYRSWGFPDLGNMGDIDLLGTEGYFTYDDPYGHWHPAISTKRMIGANPKRKAIITQNTPWTPASNKLFYETFPPVAMWGAIMSTIMHGGDAIVFWRLWYNNHDYNDHIGAGYKMLDTLSSWGGKDATVPSDIAILHSYKSVSTYARPQGWAYYAGNNLKNDRLEEIRGFASEEAVLEVLLKNGYPFQYFISDYPEDIEDLSAHKIIIVPFAYTINTTTLNKLEEAVNNGTKLIILGKPETHNQSIKSTVSSTFSNLTKNPNTIVFNHDILRGKKKKFEQDLVTKLDEILGNNKKLYLQRYGKDIEASLIQKNESEKFLFVTNWENKPNVVDVGILIANGSYEILRRDLNHTRKVSINGKDLLSETDISKFRIEMQPGESIIFYIYPVENNNIIIEPTFSILSYIFNIIRNPISSNVIKNERKNSSNNF